MILGKIKENEKRVKLNLNIICSCCKKRVPGGIQVSEKYYDTDIFFKEMNNFKKKYLCGKCRDKKRISKKN